MNSGIYLYDQKRIESQQSALPCSNGQHISSASIDKLWKKTEKNLNELQARHAAYLSVGNIQLESGKAAGCQ